MFEVTAISYMPDGRPFVASIESKKYPIFGTQFHPEQAVLFYGPNHADHSWLSIRLNRHFADYFIYLARHSPNSWGDFETTQKAIVENNEIIVTKEGTWYAFP
jgi:gamma-glutamyl hydrolase